MAGEKEVDAPYSRERSAVIRQFLELGAGDQLIALRQLREYVGAAPDESSGLDRLLEQRADALTALQAAAEALREEGSLASDKAPTARQFDDVSKRLDLGWNSSAVVRAFSSWRNAARALLGERVNESAAQRALRRRIAGRRGRFLDPLVALRLWLETAPNEETRQAYDDFVRARQKASDSSDQAFPRSGAIATRMRLPWSRCLEVARGPDSLEDARTEYARELSQGNRDGLVSAGPVAVLLGIRSQGLEEAIETGKAPHPVARIGQEKGWLLGDVLDAADGVTVRREPYSLQDRYLVTSEMCELIGRRSADAARTEIKRGNWHRVPQPAGKVASRYYWLRSDVIAWKRDRDTRGEGEQA